MEENKLKHIDGKKIRRQYFNVPLIILCSSMLAIPYTVFTISFCMGKFDPSAWPSTFWISVWVCFCFSLPLLILRTLNKHFFGRIICVLAKDGIYYPKGMLRWETIDKIEYAIDAKPRYKSDSAKAFRAIIYTKGGKHVVLPSAPLYIVSRAKKYREGLNVQISGASSLLSVTLLMAVIISLCPLYAGLLINAPGASAVQFMAAAVIWIVLGIIRTHVFDMYAIRYRFWCRILPKKWLSYIILWCYYLSFFASILVLSYFPNWVVVFLIGIYLGVVQPPIPSRYGSSRHNHILSYEQLYEIYINKAEFWEKNIEKNKEKGLKKKD